MPVSPAGMTAMDDKCCTYSYQAVHAEMPHQDYSSGPQRLAEPSTDCDNICACPEDLSGRDPNLIDRDKARQQDMSDADGMQPLPAYYTTTPAPRESSSPV